MPFILAQRGERHTNVKALRGSLRGLIQVSDSYQGSTFRIVYTNKLPDALYVLHAFQKKAKHGASTPKHEIELIRRRYRADDGSRVSARRLADEMHREYCSGQHPGKPRMHQRATSLQTLSGSGSASKNIYSPCTEEVPEF